MAQQYFSTDPCRKLEKSIADAVSRSVTIGPHRFDVYQPWTVNISALDCDLILSRHLLPAIRHVSCEFIFQQNGAAA